MLGPGERGIIEALDWTSARPDLDDMTTVVTTESPGAGREVERLARRDDGACVFLGDDDLCELHRHFGASTKPLMCRIYPFGFYPIGGRVAVDCSFACRAVSRDQGAPLETRTPEWSALLSDVAPAEERPHRLSREYTIDGAGVWALEHLLVGFLAHPELSLYDRVRCCLQLTRLVAATDPSRPSFDALTNALATGLPRQIAAIDSSDWMDRTQRAVVYQWLYLTLNPVAANLDLLPPGRRRKKQRLMAGELFRRRVGRPTVDGDQLSVDFAAVAEVEPGVFAERDCAPLTRYLQAKIIGQRLLIDGDRELPLSEAVPALMLTYPMTIWTAKALAAEAGRPAVEESHVRDALRLIDRTFGHIPISLMPKKLAKAWRFLLTETEIVVSAVNELLGREQEGDEEEDPRLRGLDLPI